MFRRKVLKTIEDNCLLNKGDKVLVALSGGADSVSLLVALKSIGQYDLYAAHLNHSIRKDEADRDELFCRGLCEDLGIPFFSKKEDIPHIAKKRGISLETCAREVRYEFLFSVAEEVGVNAIATAHNADDNAETLIMNICRGAGLDGLRGIPLKRDRIIRPLLYISRAEILQFLQSIGQTFVTDSTNLIADCTRNRIRLNVLPEIKDIYPKLTHSVSRMTKSITEDSSYLNSLAQKEFTQDVSKIDALPLPIKKRVLSMVCKDIYGISPESVHIDELIRLCSKKVGIAALPNGVFLCVKGGSLAPYEKNAEEAAELKVGETVFWKNYKISCQACLFDNDLCRKINNSVSFAAFNCDIINDTVTVRGRKDGDKILIAKRKVTKSLKKLFNECKIPPNDRDSIPVIAINDCLLWVYGLAKSGKYLPKAGENAVIISIEKI